MELIVLASFKHNCVQVFLPQPCGNPNNTNWGK